MGAAPLRSCASSMVVVAVQGCKDNGKYATQQHSAQLHQRQALSFAYDLRQDVYAGCVQEGACKCSVMRQARAAKARHVLHRFPHAFPGAALLAALSTGGPPWNCIKSSSMLRQSLASELR